MCQNCCRQARKLVSKNSKIFRNFATWIQVLPTRSNYHCFCLANYSWYFFDQVASTKGKSRIRARFKALPILCATKLLENFPWRSNWERTLPIRLPCAPRKLNFARRVSRWRNEEKSWKVDSHGTHDLTTLWKGGAVARRMNHVASFIHFSSEQNSISHLPFLSLNDN